MSKYESLKFTPYTLDNTASLTVTNSLKTNVHLEIQYQRSYENDGVTYNKDIIRNFKLDTDESTQLTINLDAHGFDTSMTIYDFDLRTSFKFRVKEDINTIITRGNDNLMCSTIQPIKRRTRNLVTCNFLLCSCMGFVTTIVVGIRYGRYSLLILYIRTYT